MPKTTPPRSVRRRTPSRGVIGACSRAKQDDEAFRMRRPAFFARRLPIDVPGVAKFEEDRSSRIRRRMHPSKSTLPGQTIASKTSARRARDRRRPRASSRPRAEVRLPGSTEEWLSYDAPRSFASRTTVDSSLKRLIVDDSKLRRISMHRSCRHLSSTPMNADAAETRCQRRFLYDAVRHSL